jgi:hypothetical protein
MGPGNSTHLGPVEHQVAPSGVRHQASTDVQFIAATGVYDPYYGAPDFTVENAYGAISGNLYRWTATTKVLAIFVITETTST